MRFGRCLAAGGAIALVLLTVVGPRPAYAAAPTLSITAPGAGDIEKSAVHVTGSVSQPGGTITSVTLSIVSDDGWGNAAPDQSYAGTSNSVFTNTSVDNDASVSFDWTVNPPVRNGQYTVTVRARTHANGALGGGTDYTPSASRSFSFELVPSKVTGVAAGWDNEAAKKAKVVWKANPEADIAFYQVLRSYANGNPAKVGGPVPPSANPSFIDDLSGKPAGQYKYQVQAIRHARTGTGCQTAPAPEACSRGVSGLPSAYSAALTIGGTGVTAPPPTTTTTKKPSTGGGSTGGGSTGGGSTGGGTSGGTSGGTDYTP
ncbi:MAG: hypothetical protein QOF21_1842, partial [Actinomycetota bacterium]